MKRTTLAAMLFLFAVPLFAQNPRTFVSAINGNDTGNTVCGAPAPCRSLAHALANTNAGGDIVVLDSGGYGQGLTIAKAINITVPDGIYASLTPTAFGATGIVVAAGSGDVVRINGLGILGNGVGNFQIGVSVGDCKRLELRNMNIRNVAFGVVVLSDVRVQIRDLTISDFNYGIWSRGVSNNPDTSLLKVVVVGTTITGGNFGVVAERGSTVMRGQNTFNDQNRMMYLNTSPYQFAASASSCSAVDGTVWNNGYFNNPPTASNDLRSGGAGGLACSAP